MSTSERSTSQLLNEIQQLRAELDAGELATDQCTAELYKNEERFSLALDGASDGLWDWNLETDEVYYSPCWLSMLGYDKNDLKGNLKSWLNIVHPDDKHKVLNRVQDYLAGRIDLFEIEMRLHHKNGHEVAVLSRGFKVSNKSGNKVTRLVGSHLDISKRKRTEAFNDKNAEILEMIALGRPASDIYDAIALMYEARHPGLRCSMLELHGNKLMLGGAPSLPKKYREALNGLENGPNVGSCGSSTYTAKRVLVENIDTDARWAEIKHLALAYGLRCCWSEPIKNSTGKVLGAFGMYYNHPALPNEDELHDLVCAARLASIVMQRDQSQKYIRQLAYNDHLTVLASRTLFCEHLEELIKTAARHEYRFALLYVDLDGFKEVNDSLGHDAGDLLLKCIASRLQSASREIDFVARLSGDEFCIIAQDIDDDYAANVAQRCLDAVSQPIELSGRKLIPACSIGIAHFPDDGKDLTTLIKAADTSLYAAKENGRHQYAFYKPELTQKAEHRFQVEQYLREAIKKQQLTLLYQPQIEVSTGKIIGVEALLRWYHPRLGQVPPSEFIPISERILMIRTLTEWVLNTACEQAVAWRKAGFNTLCMAVNISPSHFLDKGIVSLIQRVIDDTGTAPAELKLEVTENVAQSGQQNLTVFRDLKALGIKLAIDHFGTGYSSFASLKHLEMDCLKIDKYFVKDMLTDKKALTLISSMIEMAHNLGYSIIVEGVETTVQLNILKDLGCETVQGSLFSKPVKANEMSELLNSHFVI